MLGSEHFFRVSVRNCCFVRVRIRNKGLVYRLGFEFRVRIRN